MKVKDIERTANVAWSPKCQFPIYLAAGTAAQQLDASFNTNAALEVYSLNLGEPGPDTKLVSSVPCDHRFHKIIWGSHSKDGSNGTIIGGCDGGLIQIYNSSKLIKGEPALMSKEEKHTGPVHALDFNSFQQNLFATGAGNSEIFIWDLNNTSTPMSPGTKTQPLEDILSVSWNKQVQHILASTFTSKCVIWDLRKNEPIIKLTDTVSRIRWKVVAWHPEVATQLCLASEEDHSPIIQLWDLRFATSPLKTLENHQRGVLSIAWCSDDPDLLISCAKDNRILCWNPNSNQQNGEVLSELAKTNQWSFDLAWCPRNPALIASSNFDGHVSIYSLMGGKTQQIQTTNKIADSFPGMDGYVQAPVPQHNLEPVSVDLAKPPKWLKKPCGVSFGFGGKLITFENDKEAIAQIVQNAQPGQAPPAIPRVVYVSQVITEATLVKKSSELEKALEYGNFTEYCTSKADETQDQHKKYIWHFLKANFEPVPRTALLNLLGYSIEDVNCKLNEHVGDILQNNFDNLAEDFASVNRVDDISSNQFNSITQSNDNKKDLTPFKIKTTDDTEGLITQALLLNNVEAAVGLCLKAKRFADALIIATTGAPDLLARTQHKYLEQCEGYVSSLISAIVSEDWGNIINNCDVSSWKEALAAALTHASEEDLPFLCEQLGNRLERESTNNPKLAKDAQLCYIVAGSFDKLVSSWSDTALKSTDNLQELVELVTFLQKAVERQGRKVEISGALGELLSHYASLLASQGDLVTAVTYLGTTTDEKVLSLRERLYVALGYKPQVQDNRQQQSSRRSSHRTSFSSYLAPANNFNASTNPFHSSLQNQFNAVPQPITAQVPAPFNQNQFNTGLPNPTVNTQPWQVQPTPVSTVNNFNQPPPKPFSPAPPPSTQPPRPTSVGSSQGGTSGLPSRKYILDPSVTSNPYGAPTRSMMPIQPSNSFQPNSYSNSPFTSTQDPHNTMISNPVPMMPINPMSNVNSAPFVPNYDTNPVNSFNPPPMGSAPPPYTSNPGSMSPAGWNDPPVLNRPSKVQAKPEVTPSEPITHPLYGTAPAQTFPTNGYGDSSAQQYNQMSMYPQSPPQMFQPPTNTVSRTFDQSGYNQSAFNQNAVPSATQQKLQEIAGAVRADTPQPAPKAPIPEEHIHMKTVLDELRNQCSFAAQNPQTKRKLEDVSRKLECLYDLLRENKLSQNALSSLHQMIQLIQNGDYTNGLNLHTQLVAGPDFAQIASFMPGLKVLLQCALQLQVYIR